MVNSYQGYVLPYKNTQLLTYWERMSGIFYKWGLLTDQKKGRPDDSERPLGGFYFLVQPSSTTCKQLNTQ